MLFQRNRKRAGRTGSASVDPLCYPAAGKQRTASGQSVPQEKLPRHIGIIMDGNGRWAKKRGLPRSEGHRAGARAFRKITEYCCDIGIQYLTVYAFSTENWKRPQKEIDGIMDLLREYLRNMVDEKKNRERIQVRFIGDRTVLAADIQEKMREAEEETAANTRMVLNIAINYGGRSELTSAVRRIAKQVQAGNLDPEQIDEDLLSASLDTAGQPDPDLIIRPSGEWRLSNFMTWQSAYAEMVVLDVLWPDFTPRHLDEALRLYAGRDRRFGGV